MFSIGEIFKYNNKVSAYLFSCDLQYQVSNPEEIPKHDNVGLFYFNPQDQFCRWVNMDQIEFKK